MAPNPEGAVAGAHDEITRRFTESAVTREGTVMTTADFHSWLAERSRVSTYQVHLAPLDGLGGWHTDPDTGNLRHRSGRFYTIEGVEVSTAHRPITHWTQPIIVQSEIGILGILVKRFNGVLHCLMQAKMEPGNINTLQLAPTIQATRSNYTRVHEGNSIPYLEYFDAPRRGTTLVHTLQSEQGAGFFRKRNRNIVVEATGDVPVLPGFCWLTLAQIHDLLRIDNLVNMDARSVLSTVPMGRPSPVAGDSFHAALLRSFDAEADLPARTADLVSWFTEIKARRTLNSRPIPLNEVRGWRRTPERIHHEDHRFFSIVGVDVEASDREVRRWSQPLIAPAYRGVIALITRQRDGVLQVLLQARTEAGTFDVVELAPSVQCAPDNYRGMAAHDRPPFLDHVLSVPESRIRFDVVHSEEGGRFYHAENRYMIIEAGADLPADLPDGYTWATVRQITDLMQHGHYFDVEARSLLTCLRSLS